MGTRHRPMLWLYIGLPLGALLLYILSTLAPKSYPDYSTYSPGPKGNKAYYLLMERLKYPVSRIREITPEEGQGLMVMIEANVNSKKEAYQLINWVSLGNNLLIVNSKPDQLSKILKLTWTDEFKETNKAKEEKLRVKSDNKYFKDVTYLSLSLGQRLKPKAPGLEVSYQDKTGAYFMILKRGQGRILYLTDSSLFTNKQINAEDNSVFLVNLMNNSLAQPDSRLWVNEWVHGFTPNTEVREVLTWPIRLVVIQLLLGVLVLFHYWGKGFSRPVPVPAVEKGLVGDMVTSLANIYRQGRARNLILANTYQSFRRGLAHYLGIPVHTANAKILSIIAQRPHMDALSLEKLLQQIERKLEEKRLDESELLNLVRQMEIWQQDNLTSLQERRKNNDGK